MFAGVNCRHHAVRDELEFLHGQGLVQVLLLNVLSDLVVGQGIEAGVGGTEEHAGNEVEFVVRDVHGVVSLVFLAFLFFLFLFWVQDDDIFTIFPSHLLFMSSHRVGHSSLAEAPLKNEELLGLAQVDGLEIRVSRSHPLPSFVDFGEFVAGSCELVRGKFPIFLELVCFWGWVDQFGPLLFDLLSPVQCGTYHSTKINNNSFIILIINSITSWQPWGRNWMSFLLRPYWSLSN